MFAFALTLLVLGLTVPAIAFGGSILVSFVNVSWAEVLWVVPLALNRFSHRYGVD